ncbi:MAG TPA: glycosyl hydrolase family 28-related protein [Capsulimonadaceae bacterium]|jgi:hypothetical protein
MPKFTDTPSVFWVSDPVLPDETVLVSGAFFDDTASVEIARLPDSGDDVADWRDASVLQRSDQSLKAVIPAALPLGVYRLRVRSDAGVSAARLVNAPAPWWLQGDSGAAANAGGWVRVFGKCLHFDRPSVVRLSSGGRIVSIECAQAENYSLTAALPADLAAGAYAISVSNGYGGDAGFVDSGMVTVNAVATSEPAVVSVLDFGADPTGKLDCTLAIVQAMERLSGLGGGIVTFPGGRYRIDSILRSGMFIRHPLRIAPGITLRGESADTVSLWWPDKGEPLPTLIEGGHDFGVEDVSIYTQGRHRNIISGESNVRIRRVRIRANCYYMTGENGRPHHRRSIDERASAMGTAIEVWGENVEVTDCDIYTSATCFNLKHLHNGFVARNKVRASNMVFISGGSNIIFEDNSFEGNQLASGGNNIALHFGASSCRHVYYARNRVAHIYGGDHEALTFDGHGTAYFGLVRQSSADSFDLTAAPITGRTSRDSMATLHDVTAYILAGRGAGQYRSVASIDGKHVTLAEPWQVAPDDTSVVSIGGFNGRHLIIGNIAEDTGAVVQLYPPNCECIVAENKAIHASNFNIVAKLGVSEDSPFTRAEASWYNQVLDNHVVHGNAWGGGETEIDRWLGGETMLNIWGWSVSFHVDQDNADQDRPLTAADVAALLKRPQPVAIPISRYQVVRRHRIDNNSSIRVRGTVADCVIENCSLSNTYKGISIDDELPRDQEEGLDMLCFAREGFREPGTQPYLAPTQILVRNNHFDRLGTRYTGTALCDAVVIEGAVGSTSGAGEPGD